MAFFVEYFLPSHLRNDLYCLGWGVKLYSLTQRSCSSFHDTFVQGAANKVPFYPSLCIFLSSCLEFQSEILPTYLVILCTHNNNYY